MSLEAGRRGRAQAPFLLVLAVVIAAVIFLGVEPEHWRRGVGIIAAALFVAALLRLVLRSATAGLLAVRARWFDVLCYLALGVAILVISIRLKT